MAATAELSALTFSKTTLILRLEDALGRLTCLYAHSMLKVLSYQLACTASVRSRPPPILFSGIQHISGHLSVFSLSSLLAV